MDDGSTDHTEQVVTSFSDARIKYEWAPNSGGPATPRNRGLSAAKAPWISFLDADDVWSINRLKCVAEAIESQPETDVFCHNELLHYLDTGKKTLLKYGPYEPDFYRVMLTKANRLSTSAVTIRTSFLTKHKLRFDEDPNIVIVEDYDLWLRLAYCGATFYFIQDVLGEYIIANDNISQAVEKSRRNLNVLLKKHIYHIQQFEDNKDKLMHQISAQREFSYALDDLLRTHRFSGVIGLIGSMILSPGAVLKYISSKLSLKFRRKRFI